MVVEGMVIYFLCVPIHSQVNQVSGPSRCSSAARQRSWVSNRAGSSSYPSLCSGSISSDPLVSSYLTPSSPSYN